MMYVSDFLKYTFYATGYNIYHTSGLKYTFNNVFNIPSYLANAVLRILSLINIYLYFIT